jgi:hypothetical protein
MAAKRKGKLKEAWRELMRKGRQALRDTGARAEAKSNGRHPRRKVRIRTAMKRARNRVAQRLIEADREGCLRKELKAMARRARKALREAGVRARKRRD